MFKLLKSTLEIVSTTRNSQPLADTLLNLTQGAEKLRRFTSIKNPSTIQLLDAAEYGHFSKPTRTLRYFVRHKSRDLPKRVSRRRGTGINNSEALLTFVCPPQFTCVIFTCFLYVENVIVPKQSVYLRYLYENFSMIIETKHD